MERVPAGRSSRSRRVSRSSARMLHGPDLGQVPRGAARQRSAVATRAPARAGRRSRRACASTSALRAHGARPSSRFAARSSAAALAADGPVQLPDPVREARPHLALHLVEHGRQPTLDLEADLLDQVGRGTSAPAGDDRSAGGVARRAPPCRRTPRPRRAPPGPTIAAPSSVPTRPSSSTPALAPVTRPYPASEPGLCPALELRVVSSRTRRRRT